MWIDEYITVWSFNTLDYKLVFAKGPKLHVTSRMKMACTMQRTDTQRNRLGNCKVVAVRNKVGNIAKIVTWTHFSTCLQIMAWCRSMLVQMNLQPPRNNHITSYSGVTRPGPTQAWARVSADLLAVAVLQIAITSVTSHVRRQYWLDDFIHEKKDRKILTGNSYRLNLSYSRSWWSNHALV